MDQLAPALHDLVARWPEPARRHFLAARGIILDVSETAQIGPLNESLKWGQPAWRPRRPRIGVTLRLDWSDKTPDRLMAFVDCKTDLADQMSTRFPGKFENDGRRALAFDLKAPLPGDAIAQLAQFAFTYYRLKT
ncbi:hypothetical protein [Tateyamaria sp.]|uniref:hypothetical protein n=1 Tax=Tateyamaria sp. TaxID=1929288 RepID=UPI00329DA291